MPTPVLMPQMGESIAEGTIVRWLKHIGDSVERDEPLFELSTDKVDAEVPSPAAGVLLSIVAKEGDTVPIDSVVATIGALGESPGAALDAVPDAGAAIPTTFSVERPSGGAAPAWGGVSPTRHAGGLSRDGGRRLRSSPLVRRIAREQGVDVGAVAGTGSAGRVTKRDILAFLEQHPAGQAASSAVRSGLRAPVYAPGEPVELKPLSVVRRKIAEHMVFSRRTSAHVHTVFHVDFSAVERARAAHGADGDGAGVKVTAMAYIAHACTRALRRHPILNAALDGDTVVYKKDINLGVAVAIEGGLIVPVVRHADTLSVVDLAAAIADVAQRARAKQLRPEDVHGGTFTVTNPGRMGAQFGMPIINQPQVAILGVGTIEKRAVVVDDAVVARPMAYLALGFDHRLIDGFVADQFMADVKQRLEAADVTEPSDGPTPPGA